MDRAKPEMGNSLPSWSLVVQGGNTKSRVAAREPHSESPHEGGLVGEEIVSVVRFRGYMIELSNVMKKHPVKMLLDSRATRNFISDAMATALKLQVQEDEELYELMLADGIVVTTIGYVLFVLNCRDCKGKIMARVFPILHKECILGMP